MTNWADSRQDLCSSKRFNDQVWNYDFYIAITLRSFSFCANVRISQGMGLHMLHPDRSSVETSGGLECCYVVYFGHKLCQSNWEEEGLSRVEYIWGYKESAQGPPTPSPQKASFISQTRFFFIIIFRSGNYKTVEVRKLKNFNEVEFLRDLQMNDWILHAITQMIWGRLETASNECYRQECTF